VLPERYLRLSARTDVHKTKEVEEKKRTVVHLKRVWSFSI